MRAILLRLPACLASCHFVWDRANRSDGPQKPCICSRGFLMRDDAFDPPLLVTDLGVQHDFESIVHILAIGGGTPSLASRSE